MIYFKKNIIPDEILHQYFFIESPLQVKDFDWKRNEEIMMQNLAFLIICFGDIYEFIYEEESMPIIKEKIGRNQLCPCGSGKKYKKCCGE